MSYPSRFYYADRAYQCEIPEHLQGKKVQAKWVTYHERSLFCCDFSGYETRLQDLLAEIEYSDIVIRQQPQNSLLLAIVLHQVKMTPEIVDFLRTNATRTPNPIRKMAVLFLPNTRRLWYQFVQHGIWPQHTAFLDDYENAKKWLINERG